MKVVQKIVGWLVSFSSSMSMTMTVKGNFIKTTFILSAKPWENYILLPFFCSQQSTITIPNQRPKGICHNIYILVVWEIWRHNVCYCFSFCVFNSNSKFQLVHPSAPAPHSQRIMPRSNAKLQLFFLFLFHMYCTVVPNRRPFPVLRLRQSSRNQNKIKY